jgi:hypothetical protein
VRRLGKEQHSRLLGREYSFSHNYPKLLQQAGFEILAAVFESPNWKIKDVGYKKAASL